LIIAAYLNFCSSQHQKKNLFLKKNSFKEKKRFLVVSNELEEKNFSKPKRKLFIQKVVSKIWNHSNKKKAIINPYLTNTLAGLAVKSYY